MFVFRLRWLASVKTNSGVSFCAVYERKLYILSPRMCKMITYHKVVDALIECLIYKLTPKNRPGMLKNTLQNAKKFLDVPHNAELLRINCPEFFERDIRHNKPLEPAKTSGHSRHSNVTSVILLALNVVMIPDHSSVGVQKETPLVDIEVRCKLDFRGASDSCCWSRSRKRQNLNVRSANHRSGTRNNFHGNFNRRILRECQPCGRSLKFGRCYTTTP